MFGLALLGAGSGRYRGKRIIVGMLLAFVLTALSLTLACGSGGGGSHTGTPPGQYQVTVTANSGSLPHSTAVTITVQWVSFIFRHIESRPPNIISGLRVVAAARGGSSPRREKHHSPREPGKVRGTGIITATDTALPRDASHSDNAVSCQ